MYMKKYRYLLEFGCALVLYLLVLFFSISYLKKDNISDTLQIIITLLPIFPIALIIFIVLRQFSRLDELQLRIQLSAIAFAFLGTAFISFSYGFLEIIGFPILSMFVIWPVIACLWCLGFCISIWRYR
ncbi:hypothetical protein [Acinetobacter ursingii]|uniref:hypothetical protein n=1 Tax=Acinetobacter ursingii TaxID=108980 RepID=UPI00208E34E5|nr:hypothetical protein [Acinetobacter ursingii]